MGSIWLYGFCPQKPWAITHDHEYVWFYGFLATKAMVKKEWLLPIAMAIAPLSTRGQPASIGSGTGQVQHSGLQERLAEAFFSLALKAGHEIVD